MDNPEWCFKKKHMSLHFGGDTNNIGPLAQVVDKSVLDKIGATSKDLNIFFRTTVGTRKARYTPH